MVTIGDKLRDLRKAKNFTQQQVADRINVSKAAISSYELSDRLPSYQILVKFAQIYKVSTDYLLGIDDKKVIDVTNLTSDQVNLIEKFVCELEKVNHKGI